MPYKDREKRLAYHREYNKKWYAENREDHLENGRNNYHSDLETNRQRKRERAAAERANNPAASRQRSRKHYVNNRDQERERVRQYRIDNPEANYAYSQAYLLRRRGVTVEGPIDRDVVADLDDWICQLCGWEIDDTITNRYDPGYLHVDHIVPLSKGGIHAYTNVQATHAYCNMSKHNKTD